MLPASPEGITPVLVVNAVTPAVNITEAAFLSKLILEDVDGLPFVLHEPLTYASALLNLVLTVPKGFATDLASIPRLLWNILPPIGKYDRAAVIHDFLYRVGSTGVTRAQADGVLKEGMKVKQVSAPIRWAIYTGVRTGGWCVWSRYAEARAAKGLP